MPSPIAHLAAGYAVYYLGRSQPQPTPKLIGPFPSLLLVTTGFSLLPDVDAMTDLLTGEFGRFHKYATHSLIVGLGVALAFATLMWWKQRSGFRYWLIISWLCYGLHVLMDSATVGRGVMALWPLSIARYLTPLPLFYGLQWSDGWLSIRHLWTLVTEAGFVALIVFLVHFRPTKKDAVRV
jgi:membrane-bound metal-dependent hydrolase YbcI (DUF457 family)